MPFTLDVTRLLSRAARPTPTGIDRVEIAYAAHLAQFADTRFSAITRLGTRRKVRKRTAHRTMNAMLDRWGSSAGSRTRFDDEAGGQSSYAGDDDVYVHVGHTGLERLKASALRNETLSIAFIHDIIPITHPHLCEPGAEAKHRLRMGRVRESFDHILVNSRTTERDVRGYLDESGAVSFPVTVNPLGIDHIPMADGVGEEQPGEPSRPFFMWLGTVEERKNLQLLLDVWQRWSIDAGNGETIPELVIVGRRGWGCHSAWAMIDRCPEIQGHVRVMNEVPNDQLLPMFRQARAVVIPSLVEGFSYPLLEAAYGGAHVVASDIPVHRELPLSIDLLPPFDRTAWYEWLRGLGRSLNDNKPVHRIGELTWRHHFERFEQTVREAIAVRG